MDIIVKKTQDQNKQPMLSLSNVAVEKIKSMMVKEQKEDYGLRVGLQKGGCAGLSYEMRFQKVPYDNDIVIEQDHLKIFINPENAISLKGIEIDYIDTLKESGFRYRNPNAQRSCSCGTSFSLMEGPPIKQTC